MVLIIILVIAAVIFYAIYKSRKSTTVFSDSIAGNDQPMHFNLLDGHHVGYVPADLTSEIRKVAELPCTCFCYIGRNNGTYFSDCYISRQ